MKQMITAGKHVDMLTHKELADVLKSHAQNWYREAHIGTRFHRFAVQGTVKSNALDMGGGKGEKMGPEDGFVWDIRRLRIAGLQAGDVVTIGINDNSASTAITDTNDINGWTWLFQSQLVLQQGDALKIYGSGLTTSAATVTVSGMVRELPVHQIWRLGGA